MFSGRSLLFWLQTYQVLQLVEEETTIIVVQTDVEEVNGSTSDEIQQSTQMGSPNVDHNYQKPTEELNTLENIINAFGTIDWVTKKRWPQIQKQQADKKLVRTLSDHGSSDQL